jgi:Uma2 family endonuclease
MNAVTQPTPRRWTRDEYYRLAEAQFFYGQRVQLIDGVIIQSPKPGGPAIRSHMCVSKALWEIFDTLRVRPQMPLNVPGESDPEPDFAVTERPVTEYHDHPATAVLVVEIADGSIFLDRRKAGLYASAGIPDYWIVNVVSRRLEVFRHPVADKEHEFGYRYVERFEFGESDIISPVAAASANVAISSLFWNGIIDCSLRWSANPLPNPPPEYRGRGRRTNRGDV